MRRDGLQIRYPRQPERGNGCHGIYLKLPVRPCGPADGQCGPGREGDGVC